MATPVAVPRAAAIPERHRALRTKPVPAVEKVFAILETLARSRSGMTLGELARASGVAKSSVHSIVTTLERGGYVRRTIPSSRYVPGLRLGRLTSWWSASPEIRDLALPHMRRLWQTTRLQVVLGILDSNEVAIAGRIDSSGTAAQLSAVDKRLELHCTAVGKALLFGMSALELETLVRERGLPRYNDNTIASLRQLRDELNGAERRGFACNNEERVLGIRCVAAPVRHSGGRAAAAVGVSGTSGEVMPETLAALGKLAVAAASAIAADLEKLAYVLNPRPAPLIGPDPRWIG